MPMTSLLILVATALFASIVSGMTGMGGGTILLAVMASVVETSSVVPLHAGVQLVSNSTRLILFFKHIRWKILLLFIIGIIPGALVGIYVFRSIDKDIVKLLMGVFILLVTYLPKSKRQVKVSYNLFIPVGLVAGLIGIFFGAIGPFIAPFFVRKDILKEELVATKAACQAVTHVIKIFLFGFIGINVMDMWKVFLPLCAMVIIGTMIGKKFLGRMSDKFFKKLFKALLTVISLNIIITQLMRLFGLQF
jgi:uncharacterized protein